MEELKGFLEFLPNWLATILAFASAIVLLFTRISAVNSMFEKLIPKRNKDFSSVIDLILDQGFQTFSKIARLEIGETRIRRESILDESALGIYIRIRRVFDDKIESLAALKGLNTCVTHIEIEKSLFEGFSRMLLNLGASRADRFFEADSVSELNDQAFRVWTSDKILILSDYLSRQFSDSYPSKGLIVTKSEIENLISSNKSEIRDALFSAFFRIREVEIGIQKEVETEKRVFTDFKRKLFSELK